MNIFDQSNYKVIVNGILLEKRKTQKGLSRKLAEYLGVHPTLISQILNGQKDFSEEQILLVCEFLGVAQLETKYILALVRLERAGSKKLKDLCQEAIVQIRQQALNVSERISRDKILSDSEKAVFYSSWIFSAVHLLTTLERPLSFEEISKRLNLSLAKTRQILDFLLSVEMIAEKDGKFISGAVVTHLEKSSPFLSKHHTNWRLKAIQASENLSDEELMYSGNFSVSKNDFALLREMLMKTVQNFISIVKDSPAEDIAQFNLDLFWIKN